MRTFFFLLLSFVRLYARQDFFVKQDAPLRVLVTIPPFCEFVESIMGSCVEVSSLISHQICPHHYECRPSQIVALKKFDVFVCLFGDPLKEKFLPILSQSSVAICEVGLSLNSLFVKKKFSSTTEFSFSRKRKDFFYDPHIWFSIRNVCQILEDLVVFFQKKFPKKSLMIAQNAQRYRKKLLELDKKIHWILKTKEIKNLYAGHSSWNYFSIDYGLNMCLIDVNGENFSLYDLKNFSQKFQNDSVKLVFNNVHPNNHFFKNFIHKMGGKLVIIKALSRDFLFTFQRIFEIINQSKIVGQ